LLEGYKEEQSCGQSHGEQDMGPVQGRILFKSPANEKTKDDENQPQDQHSQYKKRGQDWLDVRRPGIIPKDIQPKETRQSRESKNGKYSGDQQSRQSKEQGIQVSLFHGCFLF
jgi:hypothetical protein